MCSLLGLSNYHKFGLGTAVFVRFLFLMSVVFMLVGVVYLPNMNLYEFKHGQLMHHPADEWVTAEASLGNYSFVGTEWAEIMFFDWVAMCMMGFFYSFILIYKQVHWSANIEANEVTPRNFTVMLTNLNEDTLDPQELKEALENCTTQPSTTTSGKGKGVNRPQLQWQCMV